MSWLTKLFGFDQTVAAYEAHIDALGSANVDLQLQLDKKDQEIRRLTDLMLIEHGVIHQNETGPAQEKSKPQPIGRRPSWRQVQERYEQADAQMAKTQVNALKDYWTKKDQEASKEAS